MRNHVIWAIRDNQTLTAQEKLFLFVVESRGKMTTKVANGVADMGFSRATYYRVRDSLLERRLILTERQFNGPTVYVVNEVSLSETEVSHTETPASHSETDMSHTETKVSHSDNTKKNIKNNNKKNIEEELEEEQRDTLEVSIEEEVTIVTSEKMEDTRDTTSLVLLDKDYGLLTTPRSFGEGYSLGLKYYSDCCKLLGKKQYPFLGGTKNKWSEFGQYVEEFRVTELFDYYLDLRKTKGGPKTPEDFIARWKKFQEFDIKNRNQKVRDAQTRLETAANVEEFRHPKGPKPMDRKRFEELMQEDAKLPKVQRINGTHHKIDEEDW